ncbi:hypothetical protein ACV356_17535, partial [Pseudomonas aeruginosa]
MRRTEGKPYTQTNCRVDPPDRANVDTDQIISKQFLKSINRNDLGYKRIDEWR